MYTKSIRIKGTHVLRMNMNAVARTVVNRGGARSSKSYSIMQWLVLKCLNESNLKILVVRKHLPSLRISTLMLFYELIASLGIRHLLREERKTLNFYIGNNLIHFGSIDDPEKIKSTEWNYIFMEEATEFTYDDHQILRLRLSAPNKNANSRNQLFMCFNPVDEFHWIKEKIIDPTINPESGISTAPDEVTEVHSTYKYNRFLSQDYRQMLENLVHQDPNYHRIYALGEWGKLEHLIYSNWTECDGMPKDLEEEFYGLDFGFNNPTVLLHMGYDGNEVYEEELLYNTGLTNSDLIERLNVLIPNKNKIIYADSAEPARIKEIQRAGFLIRPAEKSVRDGIDFVRRIRTNIVRTSSNTLKEKKAYSWRVDKNGNVQDEPVKFLDHAMDSERYGIYTHLGTRRKHNVKWL